MILLSVRKVKTPLFSINMKGTFKNTHMIFIVVLTKETLTHCTRRDGSRDGNPSLYISDIHLPDRDPSLSVYPTLYKEGVVSVEIRPVKLIYCCFTSPLDLKGPLLLVCSNYEWTHPILETDCKRDRGGGCGWWLWVDPLLFLDGFLYSTEVTDPVVFLFCTCLSLNLIHI